MRSLLNNVHHLDILCHGRQTSAKSHLSDKWTFLWTWTSSGELLWLGCSKRRGVFDVFLEPVIGDHGQMA